MVKLITELAVQVVAVTAAVLAAELIQAAAVAATEAMAVQA
jgi:hypothetical protein